MHGGVCHFQTGACAAHGDRGDCVWGDRDVAGVGADEEFCVEADGEDVLVVLASGEHDWELHCGVVGVFSDDAVGSCSEISWYVWLWPTMVGVPAIALTTAYYKRKFAPRVKARRRRLGGWVGAV